MHFMRGPFDIVLEGILVKLRHKIDIFHVFVWVPLYFMSVRWLNQWMDVIYSWWLVAMIWHVLIHFMVIPSSFVDFLSRLIYCIIVFIIVNTSLDNKILYHEIGSFICIIYKFIFLCCLLGEIIQESILIVYHVHLHPYSFITNKIQEYLSCLLLYKTHMTITRM
jgi:hypothetical protein